MILREYQTDAVNGAAAAFEQHQASLVVMPTGTGKTIVFAELIRQFVDKGRIMVLAHRDELLWQAVQKIKRFAGLESDMEKAELFADSSALWRAPVIASSVQTQLAGRNGWRRMQRFRPDEFSLLVVDEAHHAVSASYRAIIEYYQQNAAIKVLGVTATPDRHDERALGMVFETIGFEYWLDEAIADGWLVPIEQVFVSDVEVLDFSDLRANRSDFLPTELSRFMRRAEVLHKLVVPALEMCGDRKTLVFCVDVQHAMDVRSVVESYRPGSSAIVTSRTPQHDRDRIISAYRRGECQFLINVGIASEGFDVPDIGCIVQARPTRSRSLYEQQIGRGTRPLTGIVDGINDPDARRAAISNSGKPSVLVIDFVGNSGRHKLINAADILGGKYDDSVPALAARIIADKGRPMAVGVAIEEAREQDRRRREEEQLKEFAGTRATVRFARKAVDPFAVLGVVPWREPAYARGRRPTEKQIALLERFRVPVDEKTTFSQAHQIVGELIARSKAGLCTYRQAQCLRKFGYQTDRLSFKEASELITRLANNGWRK